MTEVSFHFNVLDRTGYTCRLVRKAVRSGAAVVLAGPAAALAHFDKALWTFDDLEFLPHLMPRPGQPVAERLSAVTRIWLLQDTSAAAHHDVLVNLGEQTPTGFESFTRLIEIVTPEEDDRSGARLRWKHYATRGYEITRHEATA